MIAPAGPPVRVDGPDVSLGALGQGDPQVRETHCATVILLGDRAYKVKKPLDLTFVDFRTPESRRTACHREVELNRRFAPDVYLGVAEVRSPTGEPCDWMVVMRRMPDARRLSRLLVAPGAVDEAETGDVVRTLARTLAAHHARAARSARIDHAGTAAALRRRWSDNLDGLQAFRDTPVNGEVLLTGALLDEIADRALRYVDGREALFAERVEAGLIRDGHGDLLADDVFCLPDGPRVLDCLEFDDDLRAVDGLDDAACLAMDLERLGRPDLGERFLAWFVEFSGRSAPEGLRHHYIAYRAAMRAKVTAMRAAQGDPAAGAGATRLAEIGLAHLRAGEPLLVLVGGAPGTGKSTVGEGLADALGAALLRSDRLRKERVGLDPSREAAAPWECGLYAPEHTAATYEEMLHRARDLLGLGVPVVLDGSWSGSRWREAARAAAGRAGATIVELRCVCPAEVAARRITDRAGSGDPSDADPEIAARMAARFAAWPQACEIDTAGPPAVAVAAAHAAVRAAVAAPAG